MVRDKKRVVYLHSDRHPDHSAGTGDPDVISRMSQEEVACAMSPNNRVTSCIYFIQHAIHYTDGGLFPLGGVLDPLFQGLALPARNLHPLAGVHPAVLATLPQDSRHKCGPRLCVESFVQLFV